MLRGRRRRKVAGKWRKMLWLLPAFARWRRKALLFLSLHPPLSGFLEWRRHNILLGIASEDLASPETPTRRTEKVTPSKPPRVSFQTKGVIAPHPERRLHTRFSGSCHAMLPSFSDLFSFSVAAYTQLNEIIIPKTPLRILQLRKLLSSASSCRSLVSFHE